MADMPGEIRDIPFPPTAKGPVANGMPVKTPLVPPAWEAGRLNDLGRAVLAAEEARAEAPVEDPPNTEEDESDTFDCSEEAEVNERANPPYRPYTPYNARQSRAQQPRMAYSRLYGRYVPYHHGRHPNDEQVETIDFIENRGLPYSLASAVDLIVQANDAADPSEKNELLQKAETYLQAEIRRQIHAGAHY